MRHIPNVKNYPAIVWFSIIVSPIIAGLILIPSIWLILTAITVPFEELISILSREKTIQILINSVVMVSLTTICTILIAVPLAFITTCTDISYKRFWTIMVCLPLVIPSYIGAFAYVSTFGPHGTFQKILSPFGVEELPSIYGLPGAIIVLTLYTYPYIYLTTRSSLKTIDPQTIDVSRTLGVDQWQIFSKIIWKQIYPAVIAGSLLVALYCLSDFGTPAIMRYDVFTRAIYIKRFNLGFSAILSLILLLMAIIILSLESRVNKSVITRNKANFKETLQIPLGKWKVLLTGFPLIISFFGIIIPLITFFGWFSLNPVYGNVFAIPYKPIFNTLLVSFAAAAVITLASTPVAHIIALKSPSWYGVVQKASYIGYAMPGVVIGLALIFFGSRYLGSYYQTLPLLIFAYAVRFFPLSMGSNVAAISSIDLDLVHASRTLGLGPIRSFFKVTFPLVIPSWLAGFSLVFLTVMKELPITLMLRPTGFETLVTLIWMAEDANFYGDAALPIVMLLIVSGFSMILLLMQEES
jgi:iron(III) transport system permease protein